MQKLLTTFLCISVKLKWEEQFVVFFSAPKTKLKSKDPLCIYFPLILSSTTLPPQNGHKNAKSHWYGWLVLPTVAILDRFDNFFQLFLEIFPPFQILMSMSGKFHCIIFFFNQISTKSRNQWWLSNQAYNGRGLISDQ